MWKNIWRHKAVRITLKTAAGVLIVYTLIGFLVIPWTLRWAMVNKVGPLINSSIYVRQVRFNPYRLALSVGPFEMVDKSGGRLAGFDHFLVDFELRSLWSDAWQFRAIALDNPFARIVINPQGRMNVLDLVPASAPAKGQDKPSGPAQTEATAKAEKPKALHCASLKVTNGTFFFRDETHAQPINFSIRPITTEVEDFSTRMDLSHGLKVNLFNGQKGSISVSGACTLEPTQCFSRIDISALDLGIFRPFLATQLPVRLQEGYLDIHGEATFRAAQVGKEPGAGFEGDVKIASLNLNDPQENRDILGWDTLAINKISFALTDRSLMIQDITLDGLRAEAVLEENGQINFVRLMVPAAKSPSSPAAPEPSAPPASAATPSAPSTPTPATKPAVTPAPTPRGDFQYHLGRLKFSNGNVKFTDRSVQPPFEIRFSALALDLGPVASRPGQQTDFQLACGLDEDGEMSLSGFVHPLDLNAAKAVSLNLKGYRTAALSPYFGKYLGFKIDEGSLQTDISYDLKPTEMTASHHLLLRRFTLGDKVDSPTAINLPIKFALALLEDSQQRIDLTVPAKGDPSDPKFKFGHIIVYAFRNLFTKIVTAPFSVIAGALGASDDEPLDFAGFMPGTAAIPLKEETKLLKIARVLNDRPKVILEIQGAYDPQADVEALKQSAYRDAYDQMLKESKKSEDIILEMMFKKYVGWRPLVALRVKHRNLIKKSPDQDKARETYRQEVRSELVDQFKVGNDILASLGQKRGQAVLDLLIQKGQFPRDRVQVKTNVVESGSFQDVVKIPLSLSAR